MYTEKDKLPKDVIIQRVLRHLEACPGWILGYDNVEKYEDIKALLPQSGGHIIITSRHHNWPKDTMIDIDVMEEEEAIKLVKSIIGAKGDEATIKKLVKELGYLPLAISQASAYIVANENMSVAKYISLYNQCEKKLLASDRMPPGDVHPPVAVTWEMNFAAIVKKAPKAGVLLNACAFLDAADISEALLLNYLSEQSINELQYNDSKMALQEYSLIRVHEKSISIHRLVQTVVRHKVEQHVDILNKVQKDLLDFFVGSALKDYEKILSSDKETAERKVYLRQLFVQAQFFLQYFKEPKGKEDKEKEGHLLLYVGDCLRWYADYEKAKKHYERALAMYRTIHGGDNNLHVAMSVNNLGLVFDEQGQYKEAQRHYEQALAMYRAIYGGDSHPAVAKSLNNLGNVFYRQGQYEQAQRYYEQALVINRAIHGGDNHPHVAMSVNNLGNVFYRQGQYEQAENYYEQVLAIHRATHDGDNHPDVARSLHNLGAVFRQQGRYEQAQRYYEQALAIHRATHDGDNHPDVARSLNNLGDVFENQGQYEEAQRYYQQALAIRIAIHGEDHPDTKRIQESIKNLEEAMKNRETLEKVKEHYEFKSKIEDDSESDCEYVDKMEISSEKIEENDQISEGDWSNSQKDKENPSGFNPKNKKRKRDDCASSSIVVFSISNSPFRFQPSLPNFNKSKEFGVLTVNRRNFRTIIDHIALNYEHP